MSIDKDIWAGLFFMGLAALGLFIGADYAFGTPARMGAGFLPKLLCWALLGLGGIITLTGIARRGEGMGEWAWGELIAILDAVLVFAASLETLGLEAAILGAVLVAGAAAPTPSQLERTFLVIAAIALAIFLAPGLGPKLVAWTGSRAAPMAALLIGAAAIAVAVVSHARSVSLVTLIERVVFAFALGVACIVIFVDGLGLTMKSVFVMDAWSAVKGAVIRPLFSAVRSLMGF